MSPLSPALSEAAVSLCALVDEGASAHQLRHPADALMVLGRQLELVAQADGLAADVAIGTLRFSLFRLHQARITQLAAHCRSITVYGLADVDLAPIPGVTFVSLPPASPLCNEWFVVVDSVGFWGALLTRAVPDRANGVLRRYLFEGALTANEQIVRRAMALLNPWQPPSEHAGAARDSEAHYARWGRLAYALAAHPEADRLGLGLALGEFPALRAILARRHAAPDALLAYAIASLQEHHALGGAVAYRRAGAQLAPAAWSGPHQPPLLPVAGSGARALDHPRPQLVAPAEQGLDVLPDAAALLVVPLVVQGRPWGALVAERPAMPVAPALFAGPVIAAAALLGQLLPPAPSIALNGAPPAPFLRPGFSATHAILGGGVSSLPAFKPTTAPLAPRDDARHDHGWPGLQRRLLAALTSFDGRGAEQVWFEARGAYSAEAICTELLMPVQVDVGTGWHCGAVSVAAEHHATQFVQSKLLDMFNAHSEDPRGPLAVIGCVQHEHHEIGAIMLSLFLRWNGFRVIYLGQNVPNSTLADAVRQLRPHVLGLSATTIEAAHNLPEAGQIVARIEPPRPIFVFGGQAFAQQPDLAARIPGTLLTGEPRAITRELRLRL